MRIQQKTGLGIFLCLSIAMVVTSIIRVSGYIYRGTIDNTWLFFWALMESDVAVIMISLTAFRSIFLAKTIQRPRKRKLNVWKTLTKRRGKNNSDQEPKIDLAIPKPTMTGIRTFIRRGKSQDTQPSSVTKATESTGPSTTLQSYGDDSIFNEAWRAEKRTPRYHYDVV